MIPRPAAPSLREKRHLGRDRNIRGETSDRADRFGRFEKASEGLEQDEVHSRVQKYPSLFFENFANLSECQSSIRFDQRAERPDRAGDKDHFTGRRLLREADSLSVDLLKRVRPLVQSQFHPVGVPGVGREDPRSRVGIVLVDFRHGSSVREIQRRFDLFRRRAARSQESPDRAVGEQDLFCQSLSEVLVHEADNGSEQAGICQMRR